MQSAVSLDATCAELGAGTLCAQEMNHVSRLIESMGLKVKKPMTLQMDNKGAVDLAHSWSVTGRSRHDNGHLNFLREPNEANVIVTEWNGDKRELERQAESSVGDNECMEKTK